jgi:LytS/YehU family sensor histidine kinase
MRFSDNLQVDYSVDEEHYNKYVAPLTLQMLVENAIKHNVVSKTHPLHIEIYTENGTTLIVKNQLQQKNAQQNSTKTGLENIRKRYHYLTNKSIEVITTQTSFLVAIPLIRVIEEQ